MEISEKESNVFLPCKEKICQCINLTWIIFRNVKKYKHMWYD